MDIRYEFDESPTVVAAIRSVATEGLIGATLTGLMILLFLHDWRSVIVVVFNIPMALLGSLLALWLTGNTINIMTLGGLALAIGMLVDEATVSIENIHVQMTHTPSLARAVERGSNETAVPRLAGHAVHPVGVHPGLHHGRAGAVAVRAAVAGGRLRHDHLLPALQHAGAGAVGLAAEAPRPGTAEEHETQAACFERVPSTVFDRVGRRHVVALALAWSCRSTWWSAC